MSLSCGMWQRRVDSGSAAVRIEDAAVARVVLDPASRRFLDPFLGRERTASDVARELGVAVSSVLYRVKQLLDLRLLEVSRVEPRGGRPVKYYRSAADSYFVPFSSTHLESEDLLPAHVRRPAQELLERHLASAWLAAASERCELGLGYRRDEDGRIRHEIVPEADKDDLHEFLRDLLQPGMPALWDNLVVRRLSPEDAKVIQRELADIDARLSHADRETGQEYVIRLALAPVENRRP